MENLIQKFISRERSRFSDIDNNRFAIFFGQIVTYYEFLLIIHRRYIKANDDFFNIKLLIHKGLDDDKMLENQRELTRQLLLEIESFYLFSKILLDLISRNLEFYFGNERKLSLDSHDLLKKNIVKFCKNKDLNIKPELVKSIVNVKENISDFRDYQISHLKNSRITKGIAFSNADKITKLILLPIYPSLRDKQIESMGLTELFTLIDKYIDGILEFIVDNRNKTILKLSSTDGDPV